VTAQRLAPTSSRVVKQQTSDNIAAIRGEMLLHRRAAIGSCPYGKRQTITNITEIESGCHRGYKPLLLDCRSGDLPAWGRFYTISSVRTGWHFHSTYSAASAAFPFVRSCVWKPLKRLKMGVRTTLLPRDKSRGLPQIDILS
jgi:hypothetical protein